MALDAKALGLKVLAELYPDATVREARATELGDAGLLALGNGVLRREDHSREMNALQTQQAETARLKAEFEALHGANTTWREERLADLQELDRLRAQVAGQPTPTPSPTPAPTPDPTKLVTPESLAATIAATEQGAVAFFTELNTLSLEHFQRFGEVLDTRKLITDKRVQQIGLHGVYAEVHKAQIDARNAKIAQEAEDKIRLDERTKVLAASASQHHPYPVRGNEPSTLDAFERPADQRPAVRTVDDMAAQYARLSAARTGAPS